MTIVTEVREALEAVSDSIGHIRALSNAIRDGREYLTTQHPEVREDLVTMCEEMQKSAMALAAASSIVTHFRFVVGDSLSSEAARFNDYLVTNKTQAQSLHQQITSMRGHCHIIKQHEEKIRLAADPNGLKSFAAALGLHSAKREKELADALQRICDDEMEYHIGVYLMADAVQQTLAAVQDELGPSGIIESGRVPEAGRLLGEYATAFAEIESKCNFASLQLQQSIDTLQVRE